MSTKENLERWAQELARQDAELARVEATLRSLGNVQLQIPSEALAEIDSATRIVSDTIITHANHTSIRI